MLRIRDVDPRSWFVYLFTCGVVPHGPGRASQGTSVPGWSRSHLSSLTGPFSLQRVASGASGDFYNSKGKNFLVATNMTKLKLIYFWIARYIKNWTLVLAQKWPLSSKKYGFGVWDPVSGEILFRIPDSDPQHWKNILLKVGTVTVRNWSNNTLPKQSLLWKEGNQVYL